MPIIAGTNTAFYQMVLLPIQLFETLPLGVWEGLRFVIVALPGIFSYFFFDISCESAA